MMRRLLALCAALTLGFLAAAPALAQDPQLTAASLEARDWLAAVDKGDYDAAWKRAGARFRKTLTLPAWQSAAAKARMPRGAVLQRSVRATKLENKPGASQGTGDVAVVVFRTSFAKQPSTAETLTLEREAQGWRVIGYHIS